MGEEKAEEKKEEKKGGGEKKDDGPITVVLKVDMHCEGCARKVKKSVKDLPGVNDVKTDLSSNKLTVVGKVDPKMVCERVQKKSQKKVELISPQPKKEEGENKKQPEQKAEDKGKNNKEGDKKEKEKEKEKEKPPSVITTVLKVYLHCDGCADTVKKAIHKFNGVQTVEPDLKAQTMTVKGTMDPNKLAEYLHRKTRKRVEVVPQKEVGKKEEKKDGDKKDGGEKKEGGGGDKKKDGGDKKDGEGKKKDGGDESKSGGDGSEESKGEGKKNEIPMPRYVIEWKGILIRQLKKNKLIGKSNPVHKNLGKKIL